MRRCTVCNMPITAGMTSDDAEFYAHEGTCFEKYMDKTYGRNKWMALGNDETDEYGGYYICAADVVGGIQGTGIYYTEWDD